MPARSRTWADAGFCFAVAGLLFWQLFVPPALSVANDNDFAKMAGRACLGPAPVSGPTLFDYTVLHWRFAPENCWNSPYRTTAELPFRAALALNRVFHSRTDFDLRYMGGVYAVILLLAFRTLQVALRSVELWIALLAQALWILVTCNAVYVPLFNTFYFDALTIASLTGALASVSMIVLNKRVSSAMLIAATFWLVLLGGSKGQHSLVAVIFAGALWVRAGRERLPAVALRAVATALILGAAWLPMATLPPGYSGEATFNALFYRILPSVGDPSAYLRETRIPASWQRYKGTHAFSPGSPLEDAAVHAQFASTFGAADLGRLYLRHPSAAWEVARENLDEASLDRVRMKTGTTEHRLANYQQSTGKPPQSLSYFFCAWPFLKHSLIANRPFVYLAYIVGATALLWVFAPRVERMPLVPGMVTAVLAVEWGICMLDGADGGRHLLVFNYLLDLVVCADLIFASRRWIRRESSDFSGKTGVLPATIPHCADIR